MKLKEARKASGLLQSELAGRLNVTQSAVARWETGKNPPLKKYHKLIARALRVSEADIDELKEK